MNPAGDGSFGCDFTRDNLLGSTGDNLPKSTGDDSPNSTRDDFSDCAGKNFKLHWGDIWYSAGEYSYTPLGNIKTAGDIKPFQC